MLAIAREEAALLSQQTGLAKYDALMDRFEPGMTSAEVDRVFGDGAAMAAGSDPARASTSSRASRCIEPVGPFRDRRAARAVPSR